MEKQTSKDSRRAKTSVLGFTIVLWALHLLAVVILGLSFFPMVYFLWAVWKFFSFGAPWVKILAFSMTLGLGYFLFGTTLILLCVAARHLLRLGVTPGLHPFYSKEVNRWMGYNALVLIANAAFLDVLRISPFQMLFYRLMGAKVGQNVQVNTGGLADLCLLEIGDNVMIGGGVALIGHAADRGFLRFEKTKLGNNVSIGLGSIIFPGVEIGDGAVIAPLSVLPRGTRVPPKGSWGGNPARDLRAERRSEKESL